MKAHNLDSGDFLDHPLYERLRRFDQMRSYLLEQIPPLLGREFRKLEIAVSAEQVPVGGLALSYRGRD
jgi:hypothetical protein